MKYFFLLIMMVLGDALYSQTFYFGVKGGPGMCFQRWNNLERDPLLTLHGDLFIESYDPKGKSSIFANIGYHQRGSSLRNQRFFGSNNIFSPDFEFRNASLYIGVKQIFNNEKKWKPYYHIGPFIEYTLSTNFDTFDQEPYINFRAFYPFPEFVNNFTYGINGGGGFLVEIKETLGFFTELTIGQGLSPQYDQDPIQGVINPSTGQPTTVGQVRVQNFSFEISVGFRFLRKVIYID